MGITADQNSEINLRRLCAQSYLYSQAKKLVLLRQYGSIALAIAGVASAIVLPNLKVWTAVIGIAWALLLTVFLKRHEAKLKKEAATIQEEFDCDLFQLNWNSALVPCKATPEIVNEAARRFNRDRNKMRDWYGDLEGIARPLDVLVCQRQSLVWDWRLHRSYALRVTLLSIGLLLLGLVIGVHRGMLLIEYLSLIFAPSLGALLVGYELTKDHQNTSTEKEKREREVTALLEDALKNPKSVSIRACRSMQDVIFELRAKGPLNPDGWYDRLRDEYQLDMYAVINDLRDKAKTVSSG